MMIVLLRTVRIFPERRGFSPRFLGTCKVPELFYCSVKFQRRRTFEKQVKSRVCSRIYIYSSIVLIIYYIYSQFFYIFVLHFSCFFPVFRGFSLALSEFFRNFGTIELYPANPMILNENQKFQPSERSRTLPDFQNFTPHFGLKHPILRKTSEYIVVFRVETLCYYIVLRHRVLLLKSS